MKSILGILLLSIASASAQVLFPPSDPAFLDPYTFFRVRSLTQEDLAEVNVAVCKKLAELSGDNKKALQKLSVKEVAQSLKISQKDLLGCHSYNAYIIYDSAHTKVQDPLTNKTVEVRPVDEAYRKSILQKSSESTCGEDQKEIRLDAPGAPLEHHPVYDQKNVGNCYAVSAAYLFTMADPNHKNYSAEMVQLSSEFGAEGEKPLKAFDALNSGGNVSQAFSASFKNKLFCPIDGEKEPNTQARAKELLELRAYFELVTRLPPGAGKLTREDYKLSVQLVERIELLIKEKKVTLPKEEAKNLESIKTLGTVLRRFYSPDNDLTNSKAMKLTMEKFAGELHNLSCHFAESPVAQRKKMLTDLIPFPLEPKEMEQINLALEADFKHPVCPPLRIQQSATDAAIALGERCNPNQLDAIETLLSEGFSISSTYAGELGEFQKNVQKFRDIVYPNCRLNQDYPDVIPVTLEYETEKTNYRLSGLDKESYYRGQILDRLKSGKGVVASYCSLIFEKDYKPTELELKHCETYSNGSYNHASAVIGFRFNPTTNSCEYLIQNSWGEDCTDYPKGIECSKGKIWVPEKTLIPNMNRMIVTE